MEALSTTALTAGTVRAALARYGIDPEPWSIAAAVLAADKGEGAADRSAVPDGAGSMGAVQARLLGTAPFVCELAIVIAGVVTELAWVHDGDVAMLVNTGGEPCIALTIQIGELISRLSQEGAGRHDDDVTDGRDGALVLRGVCLGEGGAAAGPILELVGPPGRRALVVPGEEAQLIAVNADELGMLLRLLFADRSLIGLLDDDPSVDVSVAELVALGVFLEAASVVRLGLDNPSQLSTLVEEGLAELNRRDPDVLDDLVQAFVEPVEELNCVMDGPSGREASLLRLGQRLGLHIQRSGDRVVIHETSRHALLQHVRDRVESMDPPSVVLLSRSLLEDGMILAGAFHHDATGWTDRDGGNAEDDLRLLLADESPTASAGILISSA